MIGGSRLRLAAVATFKDAYLIHGDDHGRLAERRARLRALAEQEGSASGAEVFEGDDATPEVVANALSAMTFATGRRFLIVEGVERWKDKEIQDRLAPLLAAMPPETTVAFFAREEGRTKAPAALHAAVKASGATSARSRRSSRGSCPSGCARRASASASSSTPARPRRSSRTSASASSA